MLPDVLAATLRSFSFPKAMSWDALLDDGKGELLFGRPIRWILYLYGGRVVPFTIRRTELAESSVVQEVVSAAFTYGHRFLTTSGRAGRAVKVRTFDDYRSRLAEHFVILDRQERQDRISRGLEAKARSLGGRVGTAVARIRRCWTRFPDLIEYPTVMAGTFAPEFLALPEEVLTTTMIHHQHNFPVLDDAGHLKPAFLVVTNTDAANEKVVARNYERVLTARLRDARFFWDADRKVTLDERLPRLDSIRFHKKLGTYFGRRRCGSRSSRRRRHRRAGLGRNAADAARAAGLAKADLATEMVSELSELQGVMGGIYAREEGQPERVWKAIYYHYLPIAAEADAPPTRAQLGDAATTWAAVSLADKLDTRGWIVFRRREADRVARSIRPAASGARPVQDPRRSAGADRFARASDAGRAIGGSRSRVCPVRRMAAGEPPGDGRIPARSLSLRAGAAGLRRSQCTRGAAGDGLRAPQSGRRVEAARSAARIHRVADFQKLAVAFKRIKNIAREMPDEQFRTARSATRRSGNCSRNRRKSCWCRSSSSAGP